MPKLIVMYAYLGDIGDRLSGMRSCNSWDYIFSQTTADSNNIFVSSLTNYIFNNASYLFGES